MVHVAGEAGDRHDVEAQPGRPGAEGFLDELKGVEEDEAGTFLGRQDLAQPQEYRGEHEDHAGDEQYRLGLEFLDDQVAGPEGDEDG